MQAMQMEMSTISSNLTSITTAVSSLKSTVYSAQLALLAQSKEFGFSWNLAKVQMVRLMLLSKQVMTTNPKE